MIEETATSGYEQTEEIKTEIEIEVEGPVMEVSVPRGTVRQSRDEDVTDVTISGTGKRRRFDSQENVFQLQYRSRRDDDVISGASDHHVNSALTCSINDDSISDLKAECVSETDIFVSSNNNDGYSRDTSTSSVVCFESEEMESLSTVTVNKKTLTIEATSRRKPPHTAVTMPSAAELEEFFSKAEKLEQKRFAEKYNFDIVKDVPMEGRYQWVQLKP
ncbi:putative cyclin-dependent kinase inhibitor [Helianthus annuus]|uniref:Cyclin-dependent kinase inhibitor n=1 Tax=Helianthus annuus TaxID=4232 RepID=A0A251VBQ2_HELAN|nr:cyclin-dependent kinase inhibitor 7 isoform X1 [Helianthus annuus]XP_035841524.1 cyclin-dependent kinase inhibitor 7 isoform X1 [Helianthus annuus]XP_035841525.1 cyclin-dependent kinase inhibitor 7 isoform X1 [Helianthus annuus]XP_035841526.1 cyclin-dependent kinase inhibitor 7 isoform X1 [Helianthus annuus]XP_035841527.1 cyclin-dependent kinase inhibitor 7 isoform X1 [Helianthus annuus]XP_035841528.1 cyclin-dependent kinase inhibitor 7 isoform X1 [Helianthus annuus]XP_035841529.1 cyclin-d